MASPARQDGSSPGFFGVYPALVTDIVDDQHLGRIQVRFPTLGTDGDRDVRAWATLCSPYADDEQGLQVLPAVGSQVVVAFEAGSWRRPYIIGCTWNGKEKLPHPPESANNVRMLRSRSDSRLEFDDSTGGEKVSITMKQGHRVVLDQGGQVLTIQHSNGCRVTLTAAGGIEIKANTNVSVTAPTVDVTSPVSTFSGIVRCTTVQADAFVISPAYTPGVGGIL